MKSALRLAVFGAAMVLAGAGVSAAQAAQQRNRGNQVAGSPMPRDTAALRARAQAGDRDAQTELGVQLLATDDPAQAAEARLWFRRAADAGDAEAKNNLSAMLLLGMGGPVDEAQGRRLLEEAAREGSVGANMSIADGYLRGAEGYPRDPARAFEHMRIAAASPNRSGTFALWRLGMMHLQGLGTPRNSAEAYRVFVAASERGGVRGMLSRAVMLATGDGVAEDDAAARLWYQRAAESAELGFEHGLRALGGMLVYGEGGPVDLPRGIAYLRIAQAARDEQSERILASLAGRVTPEVDRQARRIAEEWMRRYLPADSTAD